MKKHELLYPQLLDQAAVDNASEKDRVFFEQHPGAQHYFRKYIPGESPLAEIIFTKVTQIYPGCRSRQFFYRSGGRA